MEHLTRQGRGATARDDGRAHPQVTIKCIRWVNSIIGLGGGFSREGLLLPVDVWSAVMDAAPEDGLIEVRINADSTTVMTLEIERLESGELLVRGWSSE